MTKYYAAYGSNLCKAQMKRRCPKAIPMGGFELPKAQLVFNSVADVVYHPTKTAMIGLWKITDECEKALDGYEGVISKTTGKALKHGAYRKETIKVIIIEDGREVEADALIYVMNRDERKLPMLSYLGTIKEGFRDFGLDEKWLNEALKDTAKAVKEQTAERQARYAAEDRAERESQLKLPYYPTRHSPHRGITDRFDGPNYNQAQADYYESLNDRLDDVLWDDEAEIERMRLEAEREFEEFDEETYTEPPRSKKQKPREFKTVEDFRKATADLKAEMKEVERHDKSGYKLPEAKKKSPHLFSPTPSWRR